jgi:type I protein arginine methyltransferase
VTRDAPAYLDYERVSHHRSMISDRTRTFSFRDAINEVVRRDSVVVDLGSGTGILAVFAAKAGAARVYAIERTGMIDVARRIAARNGIDNITWLFGDSSEVELPEPCTVLVSECLGYFALQENMLTDLLHFREGWLVPDGALIPQDVTLSLVPVECPQAYDNVDFWSSAGRDYDIDFEDLRQIGANSTYRHRFEESELLAEPVSVAQLDLRSAAEVTVNIECQLSVNRSGIFHGVAGYFGARLSDSVYLDTRPGSVTHWQQEFFPASRPYRVEAGQRVDITVTSHLAKAMVDWTWAIRVEGHEKELHDSRQGIRIKEH